MIARTVQLLILILGHALSIAIFGAVIFYPIHEGYPVVIANMDNIFLVFVLCFTLIISSLIGKNYSDKLRPYPHLNVSLSRALGINILTLICALTVFETIFGNPVLAGSIFGSFLSIGILTRLIWYIAGMSKSIFTQNTIYAVLSFTIVAALSYLGSADMTSEGWPLWALMLPYFIGLSFWWSFDAAAPSLLKPNSIRNIRIKA